VSFKEILNDCGVEVCSLKRIKGLYHDLSGEGRYVIDGCKMPRKNVHSRKNCLFEQRNCVLNWHPVLNIELYYIPATGCGR
jgi:hypothetical protein